MGKSLFIITAVMHLLCRFQSHLHVAILDSNICAFCVLYIVLMFPLTFLRVSGVAFTVSILI